MTNIEKPKFHILEVSGKSYISWCLDMEMHLQGQDLANTITEDGTSNEKDKANALIFIRRHLHESLQAQYLPVQDSYILWRRLKDRYDHTKTVILPQAQYDWQNLILQDFKSVSTDSKSLPEAHANFEKNTVLFKGYKRRQEHNSRMDGKKFNRPRKSNFYLNHGKEKKPKKVINESICHCCGMTGHWSRTCRTPKHFVDLYQASLKNTGKRGESHAIEINPTAITTIEVNNISVGGTPLAPEVANALLDVSDFFEDL
ncbi:hypothetical protein EUGRSUZ_B02654 [Eucalyptus grandis]|uniref:Uncharacterized protein n=2 Tax=Eucalyptus grandis TaxID=71139 RepID=A0ACC3LUH0_EUCGR|nr:hypothetical protein EUGRSUZ_B02654 [Eucalyptus grandis]